MPTDPTTHQDSTYPDAAQARADLDTAEKARTASGAANALPLAALLLASGGALTALCLTVAADSELGGSSMFMVRALLSLALLIPGFIIYTTARSWARRDTALLIVTLVLQAGTFIAGVVIATNFGQALYADLAAAVIILITIVVMFVQRQRARR